MARKRCQSPHARGNDGRYPRHSTPYYQPMEPRDATDRDDDEGAVAWTQAEHIPADARRMGLSRSVPDGALLELAGSLDSSKRSHRIVAWVLLFAFAVPVLLSLLSVLR